MTLALCLISTLLAVLRAVGVKHIAFQAAAHCFVGGLVGAWLAGRKPLYMWLAVVLSIVEVVCFLVFKLKGM